MDNFRRFFLGVHHKDEEQTNPNLPSDFGEITKPQSEVHSESEDGKDTLAELDKSSEQPPIDFGGGNA